MERLKVPSEKQVGPRKYIVKTGEHEEIEYDLTDENVFKAP